MKKFQQKFTRRAGIIGMVCLLATLLTSCLKDHDPEPLPPAGLISVINASPDSQPLDFYLNNNMVNTYPLRFGYGLDYFRAYTGKRTATFTLSGSQTQVKSDTLTVNTDKFYSIFLANKAATPDLVILKDNVVKPASGQATIRFVNLSPDAPAADLVIKSGATVATNKAYKAASDFTAVQGGTYTLEIHQTGTATVLAKLDNVTIYNGSVYTVWLQGFAAATDNTKLSADIQTNAIYY